jgi:hypothetical protein
MSTQYTVTSLGRSNEWQGKHGRFIDYWFSATDPAGEEHWCFTTRKPDSEPVALNESIFGHLETKQTKVGKQILKLVKDQPPDSSGPRRPSLPSQPEAPSIGRGDAGQPFAGDPVQRAIIRQHSQEMALRLVTALEPRPDGWTAKAYQPLIAAMADWFDQDVFNAAFPKTQAPPGHQPAEGAGASNGTDTPPSPEPVWDYAEGNPDDDIPF